MQSRSRYDRRQVVSGLLAGAVAAGTAGRAAAQSSPVYTMKVATLTLNDAQHEWMRIFSGLVESGSGGRIKVELYPAGQLGSAARSIEGTQFGSIQAFVVPPEFLSGVDSRFEVLGAPGVFKDLEHANRTLQAPEFNKAFLALGANKGLKGIGVFINDAAAFNSRAKIEKLADFKGRKFRVLASAIQMEQLAKLGATGVPMSLGEVLPALQQGTIDGVMSGLPVLTALRFYDAAKFFLDSDHAMVTVVTVVSKMWYDKLPKDLQAVIDDAGQKASVQVFPWAVEFAAKQRVAWVAAGGTITKLSPDEQRELMSLLRPIGPAVTSKSPGEKALFDLMLKTADTVA
ncbi:TRAP transporter substrate-binding protein [Rhodoplanes roseus]|nr:TRAP transporter substrate-binding protein [Rhodoplanes roseus]